MKKEHFDINSNLDNWHDEYNIIKINKIVLD